jgi:hypothetical protein
MKKVVVVLVLALAACGGTDRETVHGVGEGADDLKLSPCACQQVPQARPDAREWRERLA